MYTDIYIFIHIYMYKLIFPGPAPGQGRMPVGLDPGQWARDPGQWDPGQYIRYCVRTNRTILSSYALLGFVNIVNGALQVHSSNNSSM